jgi:Calcineurin-like phosphoesterase
MNFQRRQFLALFGLGSLGTVAFSKILLQHPEVQSQEIQSGNSADLLARPVRAEDLQNPKGSPLLRFITVADTGTGARGQYAVAEAMTRYHQKNPFSLVLLAGDNIYNNGEIEKIKVVFEQPYQSLLKQGVKFQACLGNHDIRTANGDPQVRYPGFNMKGRYYSFHQGPTQFFALDTNDLVNNKAQLTWLEKELGQSSAPVKVVFGHHQIYSSGHYGVNKPFIQVLKPLFKKYQVQLYVNGHEHSYERTNPIDGTTYLITGSGAGTRPVGRSKWTATSAEKLSFSAVEVYSDRLLIQGIDTKNQVFDQGIIPLSQLTNAV